MKLNIALFVVWTQTDAFVTQGGHGRFSPPRAADVVVDVFESLKELKHFQDAWDQEWPCVFQGEDEDKLGEFFGFRELREACQRGEISEAGRGVVMQGAWNMKRIGEKGRPVSWDGVAACLGESATVVMNSADAYCPRLAELSLAALETFELPVCVNAYATGANATMSAPPHTDAQRVFVLQTAGKKRWRVFEPPDPRRKPTADPLARGKGPDALPLQDCAPDQPLIDIVLNENDLLYVPAGFPHTTETLDEDSLHLTLGVDTHIWALDAQQARIGALQRMGLPNTLRPEQALDPDLYWSHSRKTLPRLGWRRKDDTDHAVISAFIAQAAAKVEPDRFPSTDAAKKALDTDIVADRLMTHAVNLVNVQTDLYNAVISKNSVRPHFIKLEQTQLDLASWFNPVVTSPYTTGSEVQACMHGTDEFFDAVVDVVRPDGSCDVVFFDGDVELQVPPDRIRPRATTPSPAAASSKAIPGSSGFGGSSGRARKSSSSRNKSHKKRKK